MAKPFLKWAGGKGQLLTEIRKFYPAKIEKYCEPFVGGGAVLFDVLEQFQPHEVLINDINPELTNCYLQIQNNVKELIDVLLVWEQAYLASSEEVRRSLFLQKREQFNIAIQANKNTVEKAALMIYLNKTCFNGLYRVNSKGLFNVPSGVYKNPVICHKANLMAVHNTLKNVTILTGDYTHTKDFIDSKTFVYIDPPYRPLTSSSSFTAYAKDGFGDNSQIELGNFVGQIYQQGAKVLLSNSDPKNANKEDDFFDELYKDYDIYRVNAARMINRNANGRGKITELMVACF